MKLSVAAMHKSGVFPAIFLIGMVTMLVAPVPPVLLDFFFIVNITIGLTVLLTAFQVKSPLDFSALPTTVLLSTIFRLCLSVASTKVILLNGATHGTDGAGQVIEAFGEYVIQGNYVVGGVAFMTLTIINFVIAKSAERSAEVLARFELDSMPGKQMAIDSDKAGGAIDAEDAIKKREIVGKEAKFAGSMDGIAKAVKNEVLASFLILAVNIIGGLGVGCLMHGLSFVEALRIFVLMSIGDSLVAIIPSIFMSLSVGIIATRGGNEGDVAHLVRAQLLSKPHVLGAVGGLLLMFSLLPNMPTLIFLGLGSAIMYFAYYTKKEQDKEKLEEEEKTKLEEKATQKKAEPAKDVSTDDLSERPLFALEVGYGLSTITLSETSPVFTSIQSVRRSISEEFGVLVKGATYSENAELEDNCYRILVEGAEVGRATIYSSLLLAIDMHQEGLPPIKQSRKGVEPVYGYDGHWIMKSQRTQAEDLGYEILEPADIISAHMLEIITRNLELNINIDQMQTLVNKLGETQPKLVEVALPNPNSIILLVAVCKELVRERVPITQLGTILEVLAQFTNSAQVPMPTLVNHIRRRLAPWILSSIDGVDDINDVMVMTLSQDVTQLLASTKDAAGDITVPHDWLNSLCANLCKTRDNLKDWDKPAILMVDDQLRKPLYELLSKHVEKLHIIESSCFKITKNLNIAATIGV